MNYYILVRDGQGWKVMQTPFPSYAEAEAYARQNFQGATYEIVDEMRLRQLAQGQQQSQPQEQRKPYFSPPFVTFPKVRLGGR